MTEKEYLLTKKLSNVSILLGMSMGLYHTMKGLSLRETSMDSDYEEKIKELESMISKEFYGDQNE